MKVIYLKWYKVLIKLCLSIYDLALFLGMMMMAISLQLHAAKELFMKQLQSLKNLDMRYGLKSRVDCIFQLLSSIL